MHTRTIRSTVKGEYNVSDQSKHVNPLSLHSRKKMIGLIIISSIKASKSTCIMDQAKDTIPLFSNPIKIKNKHLHIFRMNTRNTKKYQVIHPDKDIFLPC